MSIIKCWLLLTIAAADVLQLKIDDELAVQARNEFAKFEQTIAPADTVLDWAERSMYREQVTDEEFAAAWVYATEESDDDTGLDTARFERFVSAVDAFAQQNLAKAPPSLGQLARGMLKSPAMRRMVTSLAVGTEGSGGLLGMDEKLKLGGGEAADEELAAQLDEMLQSEGFADLVDRVVSTPAILAAVDDAAHTGTAPKAAVLLPVITEAVCAGSGLSAAECAEVEKSAADRLNRLGFLEGDGAGGVLWKAIERLAYFSARLGASGLGGALVLAPVVALLLALFLTFIVRALAHNLQRLFGRKKRRRKRD
jgi:hypothetical protein